MKSPSTYRGEKVRMVKQMRVNLLDFTKTPGGRLRNYPTFSGEEFREDYLIPAIQESLDNGETLLIDLDGTYGFSYSFIAEAFGGLIREFTLEVLKNIDIKSEEEPNVISDIYRLWYSGNPLFHERW